MNGTNLVGIRPTLPVSAAVESIMGSNTYAVANFNDTSTNLTTTMAFSASVFASIIDAPVAQNGLGIRGNNLPENSYLEHVSGNYGRSGVEYALERGMTAAKVALSDQVPVGTIVLIPVMNEYSLDRTKVVSRVGAIPSANVPLSYSGFSSTQLIANLVQEQTFTVSQGTNPKIFVQKFALASDANQVVHIVYIGSLVISEMFKNHFADVTKAVSSVNHAAFEALLKDIKSPLATALNLVSNKQNRVIYIQDLNEHAGTSQVGGPLCNWKPNSHYATQTEVSFLLHSATPFSAFNVINSKSQDLPAATWIMYPVLQALIYEKIFNSASNWITRFFKDYGFNNGIAKLQYDVYNMASNFGNNKTQKSLLSEVAKQLVASLGNDFTVQSAKPSSARNHFISTLNSLGLTTRVGIRI